MILTIKYIYTLKIGEILLRANDTLNNMTKPADFYNNIVTTLQYLDTVLPRGSHVLLTGLANGIFFFLISVFQNIYFSIPKGSILHDALNDRIHPVGKVKNDVTYGQFYTYLTCLKVN